MCVCGGTGGDVEYVLGVNVLVSVCKCDNLSEGRWCLRVGYVSVWECVGSVFQVCPRSSVVGVSLRVFLRDAGWFVL